MKKYRVNVNGTTYEIEIEEIESSYKPTALPLTRPAAPAAPKMPVPVPKPTVNSEAGKKITAPMPGNILEVSVSDGQTVKKGEVLMILEAMKMENEIMAP